MTQIFFIDSTVKSLLCMTLSNLDILIFNKVIIMIDRKKIYVNNLDIKVYQKVILHYIINLLETILYLF